MGRRTLRSTGAVATIMTVASVVALTMGVASAADGVAPFGLDWQAPAECPDSAYVLTKAARIAGNSAASENRSVHAWATIHATPAGYQLQLVTDSEGRRGYRLLEGASCATVADAAAVIIALVLNPESNATPLLPLADGSAGRAAAPPPLPAKEPLTTPLTKPSVQTENASSAAESWRSGAGRHTSVRGELIGALLLGRLPAPSLTLGADVGLRIERIDLGLVGTWGPARSSATHSDVSTTFRTASVGPMACYLLPWGEFAAGGCALAEHLWVRGEATGREVIASPKNARWWETWAGARVEWGRGLWLVGGSAEVGLAWPRQTFLVQGLDAPAHEVGALLSRFKLTSGVRF